MNNIRPLLKRVCAYTIDMFIVLIISSLLSSIPVLNKDMDAYQETYEEYEEQYNEYSEYLKLLENSYKDESIDTEEYQKLIEVETYKEIITSKYDDESISKGEYKNIIKEINKEFDLIANDYVYKLSKKGVSNSIITLVCTLLYFGVIQYFLKGQTIGKKLFKLQVVSASEKKLTVLTYLLRSLIVNDVFLNAIGIVFLLTTSKTIYNQANNILGMLISLVEAAIIFLVLTREDKRGLHDLLLNTKVISTEPVEETNKKEIDVQDKIEEVKAKKTTNSKSKSKSKKKTIDAEYQEEDK